MSQRVLELFRRSVDAKMTVGEAMAPAIEAAADVLVDTLLAEGKILVCGNGPSSALSQWFAASLMDRYERERPSLPAIWLGANMASYTAIVSDVHHEEVYAKPIRALGAAGDALVVISSSGNSGNLVQAVGAAHERGLRVIALTGRDGGHLAPLQRDTDLMLCAELSSRARIHEVHLLTLNCLCDLIDHKLFGLD